jgi:UDP-glucose 4-epimerase
MRIGITGAGGFVGSRFMEYNKEKYSLVPLSLRNINPAQLDLSGLDAIVHLAGKAHEMKRINDQVYFDINYKLTKELAEEAKKNGVRSFVYISSVKVYGDKADLLVDEDSPCEPTDAYGKSKLQAEQYLQSIQDENFNVAIVRPPVVYGPGVKGNMIRFLNLAQKNIPLPFGGISNRRSMVFLDNLVELINRIVETGSNGIFVAGDVRALSTTELLGLIRRFMGKKEGLVSTPLIGRKLLRIIAPGLYQRLFGSFVIDNKKTNESLGFTPPYAAEYGVRQMVEWYLAQKRNENLPLPLNKATKGTLTGQDRIQA